MTVTLEIDPEIEQDLLMNARERGISLRDYLQEIVKRQVASDAKPELASKRLIEVLMSAPFAGSDLEIEKANDSARPVDL